VSIEPSTRITYGFSLGVRVHVVVLDDATWAFTNESVA
jgi:hypothetical protein